MENHVVVIDNEPRMVSVVTAVGQSEGYEVISAATGAEGLQVLQTVSPWLLIVSEYLPDMSAHELLKPFRRFAGHEEDGALPFGLIFLTAATLHMSGFGTPFSPDIRLTKPFNPAELRAIMRRIRANQQTHRSGL